MAPTYVNLEEAAKQLDISVEELSKLREDGRAHAYRDGTSWKFRIEEIERLKTEGLDLGDSSDDIHSEEAEAEESDSILLSEIELGEPGDSEGSAISTIIGDDYKTPEAGGSDLDLTSDSDLDLDSDDIHTHGDQSDVTLAEGTSNVLGGGSGVLDDTQLDKNQAADLSARFEKLDELDINLEGEPSKVLSEPPPVMSDTMGDESSGESDLSLDDSGTGGGIGGSAVQLEVDDQDDMVLGEGSDSDITLSGEDSGISLLGPSDSGLSLEHTPPELGGSAVESLKVGQDDNSFSLEESTEEAPSPDDSMEAEVKADSDFMLTPLDESTEEDADSGSQVIALESAEDLDENAVTRLGSGPMVLEEDLHEPADIETAPVAAAAVPLTSPVVAREVQFTTWNTVFLGMCGFLMLLVGMMMIDLLRNMWSWNESYALSSSLMDMILGALPF